MNELRDARTFQDWGFDYLKYVLKHNTWMLMNAIGRYDNCASKELVAATSVCLISYHTVASPVRRYHS